MSGKKWEYKKSNIFQRVVTVYLFYVFGFWVALGFPWFSFTGPGPAQRLLAVMICHGMCRFMLICICLTGSCQSPFLCFFQDVSLKMLQFSKLREWYCKAGEIKFLDRRKYNNYAKIKYVNKFYIFEALHCLEFSVVPIPLRTDNQRQDAAIQNKYVPNNTYVFR